MFKGKNFDGWEYRGGGAAPPTFDIENGTIVGRTRIPRNDGAFMATKNQFKDFELIFEVKIDEGLNSGVQIRSTPEATMRGRKLKSRRTIAKRGISSDKAWGCGSVKICLKKTKTSFQTSGMRYV